jgi:hypothetical protein
MTTNLISFICSYSCRYSSAFCKGTFAVQAATLDEAKKIARLHLIETGGIEGIDYIVRVA